MADDPAITAVAAYWKARDVFENVKRGERAAWIAAGEERKSEGPIAVEGEPGVGQEFAKAYGRALRRLERAREALASVHPATPRGVIEVLTVALGEFSKPFENVPGSKMVFCPADVPDLLRSTRDAIELWENDQPPLKEDEAK